MSDPKQAIVDADGNVISVILCDQTTADLIKDMVFPGCFWFDVTNATPVPGPGWTWAPNRVPVFRPVQPDPSWVWDYTTGSWVPPNVVIDPPPSDDPGTGSDAPDVPPGDDPTS